MLLITWFDHVRKNEKEITPNTMAYILAIWSRSGVPNFRRYRVLQTNLTFQPVGSLRACLYGLARAMFSRGSIINIHDY